MECWMEFEYKVGIYLYEWVVMEEFAGDCDGKMLGWVGVLVLEVGY